MAKKTVKLRIFLILLPLIILAFIFLIKKNMATLPWPEAELNNINKETVSASLPQTREEIMNLVSGHYAHFDIVSYEDVTTSSPMRTFIISYGFTDFFVREGKLYQTNRFVHSEQVLNQKNTKSFISDKAVQSMEPSTSEVELVFRDGIWRIYRPATPVLMGINGDASESLTTDRDDLNITDPDNDGYPGVSVHLNISGFLKGEIYIIRREIFEYHLNVFSSERITGSVKDHSEQFVLGASRSFLDRPSNNIQHQDPAMNPVILRRVDPSIDTWEELKPFREELFPPSPAFH